MQSGTVRWFKDEKGYGRITGDDGYVYFVHFSGIVEPDATGFRTLEQGQRVEFDVLDGHVADHGRKVASNVRPI